MARTDRILAGLGTALAIGSQAPAEAAVVDPVLRPIARIGEIRSALLKVADVEVTAGKGDSVVAQWPNWRKF